MFFPTNYAVRILSKPSWGYLATEARKTDKKTNIFNKLEKSCKKYQTIAEIRDIKMLKANLLPIKILQ